MLFQVKSKKSPIKPTQAGLFNITRGFLNRVLYTCRNNVKIQKNIHLYNEMQHQNQIKINTYITQYFKQP